MKKKRSIVLILALCLIFQSWISAEASGNHDTTAPVVEAITLGADEVNAPGAIEITASVIDDSTGVKTVAVEFYNKETDTDLYTNLKLESTGLYSGAINIDKYANAGEYKLCFIHVKDNVGNEMYYAGDAFYLGNIHVNLSADMASLAFTIIEE